MTERLRAHPTAALSTTASAGSFCMRADRGLMPCICAHTCSRRTTSVDTPNPGRGFSSRCSPSRSSGGRCRRVEARPPAPWSAHFSTCLRSTRVGRRSDVGTEGSPVGRRIARISGGSTGRRERQPEAPGARRPGRDSLSCALSGSRGGVPLLDSRNCQTAAASPAEPGGLP